MAHQVMLYLMLHRVRGRVAKVAIAEKTTDPSPSLRIEFRSLLGGMLALFSALAMAAGPERNASEMVLSLDRALEIARDENPRIAIGRARRAGAEGSRVRSRQSFSPRLTLNAYYLRLDTSLLDNIPAFEPTFPPVLVRRDFGRIEGNVASVELVQPLVNAGAWNASRSTCSVRARAFPKCKRESSASCGRRGTGDCRARYFASGAGDRRRP